MPNFLDETGLSLLWDKTVDKFVKKSGDTMTGDLIAPTTYAKGTYPSHSYMNADGTPVVLMQVDASNHRLAIHQKRGGASVWDSNEAYFLPAPSLDQTATVSYDILTSKNPVTIAQGGTGATDATTALANLGAFGALGNAADFGSDLNNFTQQGAILVSSDVANRPSETSVYGICWNVYGKVNTYLEQHYVNAATLKRYVRFKIDGTWREWAQEYDSNFKPTAADVGAVPTSRTVNGKALSADITLSAADVGAIPTTPTQIEFMPGTSANHGGYLDFHFNSSSADHTSRIIESSSSVLDINNISGGKVRLGTVTTGTWNGSAIAIAYGGTGAVNEVTAANNLKVQSLGHGIDIPANADLNTYTTVGNYRCSSTNTGATLANCPVANAFTLQVYASTGVSASAPTTTGGWAYFLQKLTALNGAQYYRTVNFLGTTTATFGDWVKIYDSVNNKPTAADVGAVALNGDSTVNGTITATKVIGAVYA